MRKSKAAGSGQSVRKGEAQEVPIGNWGGHWTAGNQWFKIGLAKEEVLAVKAIRADLWNRKDDPKLAEVIRRLVLTALVHYDKVRPLLLQDVSYSQAEGFGWLDQYQDGRIRLSYADGALPGCKAGDSAQEEDAAL